MYILLYIPGYTDLPEPAHGDLRTDRYCQDAALTRTVTELLVTGTTVTIDHFLTFCTFRAVYPRVVAEVDKVARRVTDVPQDDTKENRRFLLLLSLLLLLLRPTEDTGLS